MTDPLDEDAMSKAIKGDPEFEKILQEYVLVVLKLKSKMIKKYGNRAADWFGI